MDMRPGGSAFAPESDFLSLMSLEVTAGSARLDSMSTTLLSQPRDTGPPPVEEGRTPLRQGAERRRTGTETAGSRTVGRRGNTRHAHGSQAPGSEKTGHQPAGELAEPEAPFFSATLVVLRTLRKRPWWLLVGLLLGLTTELILARNEPVIYRATARVLISGSASSRLKFNANYVNTAASVQVADQAIRIKDDDVLNQLITDLNLLNGRDGMQAGAGARAALLRQLRASIAVQIVPDTRLVTISFAGLNARFTALLLNKLVDDFSQRLYQEHYESAQRAMQLPAAQLEQLKAEVQATQTEMNEVQRRLGNTGFASVYNREDKNLDDLTRQAVDARTARDQLQNQYEGLMTLAPEERQRALDTLPDLSAGVGLGASAASTAVAQETTAARVKLDAARASLAAARATLGSKNPALRALQAEVDSLAGSVAANRTRHLADVRARLLVARRNAAATDATLAATLGRAYGEGGDTLLYRKLLREFSFTRALYVGLYTRLRTAGINAGLNSVQVVVVDAAQVPGEPLPNDRWLKLLAWTLGGLLAGAVGSLGRENFRSGLRTVLEVETVTDLPSLATLPLLKLAQGVDLERKSTVRRNLTALAEPSSPFTEGLRNLRLNLDLSGPGAEPRYILFTSATPSEGKTTVAGNYAVVLAERGERVLLIDADMHRPNLHHRFGLSGRRGLSTALSGQCAWQEAVQPIAEVRNLDLLVAGPVPPSPAVLLAGPELLSLLRQAGRVYTHIVLDSPPVMAVNDGIMLSQLVDAVVYVVRHGKIDKRIVRLGRERLSRSGAPLAGIVLNGLAESDDTHAGA